MVLPSTYLVNAVLETLIASDTPFMALFTSNPGPTATGTEVSGGSYTREAISFGAVASGSMSNDAEVQFTGLPEVEATHYAIFDAVSGGNLLVYGELDEAIVADAGDSATFAVGDVVINFTGS